MNNISFNWDEETGQSVCTLIDRDKIYQGFAWCREEDRDMMNEKTGCTIAEYRAYIAWAKSVRDNEIKPKLAALKEFKNTINHSIKCDPKTYIPKMLDRQIRHYEEELEIIKDTINNYKGELNSYLKNKAEFYEKIRRNRNKDKID